MALYIRSIGNVLLNAFIALTRERKYRIRFALWANSTKVTGEMRISALPVIGASCVCALLWDEAEAL